MGSLHTEHGTGVQSVKRTFALLETLAGDEGSLGVTELATESGLPLGTIHRLLRTLVDLGYVSQNASREYALGAGFIKLGARATRGLASWSRPLLDSVVRELDESVNLAVLENDQAVYVAHVPSTRSMRTFAEVGSRVPLHSTGVGKAMLAQMTQQEVGALLQRTGMPLATQYTIADADRLSRELRSISAEGYAIDQEEQELGVRCVAVAVPDAVPPIAVSVSGPTARVSDDLLRKAVPLLKDAAKAIGRRVSS